jgi:hypothetical protein
MTTYLKDRQTEREREREQHKKRERERMRGSCQRHASSREKRTHKSNTSNLTRTVLLVLGNMREGKQYWDDSINDVWISLPLTAGVPSVAPHCHAWRRL